MGQQSGLRPGKNDVNQVYTAAATYAFEPTVGAGKRATVPPKDVPPVDAPPGKPDPDQIVSWAYAEKVLKDAGTLLTSPIRWDAKDWLIAGGVVAATGAAMLLDKQVKTLLQDHQTSAGNRAADAVTNVALIAPAVGTVMSYVMGEVLHDEKAKQRAADAVEATILSNALFVFPRSTRSAGAAPRMAKARRIISRSPARTGRCSRFTSRRHSPPRRSWRSTGTIRG